MLAVPEDASDEEVEALASEGSTSSGVDLENTEPIEGYNLGSNGLEASARTSKRTIEEDFDARGWGRSKKDYYDADAIETEGDAQEEEAEALRLQRKQLESMQEADFGLDDLDDLGGAAHASNPEQYKSVIQVQIPELEVSPSMPLEDKTRLLRTRYPELQNLAKEFVDLQSRLEQVELDSIAAKATKEGSTGGSIPLATMKWVALRAYLAALAFYFTLLTSGTNGGTASGRAKPAAELKKHTVMSCLLRCRSNWRSFEDMDMKLTTNSRTDETQVVHDGFASDDGKTAESTMQDVKAISAAPRKGRRKQKSKAQREAERALTEAEKRRHERLSKMQAHVNDLDAFDDSRGQAAVPTALARPVAGSDDSDFGEETVLPEHEAAEKARRKKSLRFYTAQIAQRANKRDLARRNMGGDTDVPYRERFRERQSRLNQEAERRGRAGPGPSVTAPGNEASDDEEAVLATQTRQAADEDYYEQVAVAARQKAADKAALKEARREAAATPGATVQPIEAVGPDGKRAITYAIERNKGLAPSGRKSVRAPRVKKRKNYEDKLKKLSSLRPQYKGGEGRGGYGGELTGIKSSLVKSIKL